MMTTFIAVFALLLRSSDSYIVHNAFRAPRCVSSMSSAAAKISILSREIELTETLQLRVESKIGKVIIETPCSFYNE